MVTRSMLVVGLVMGIASAPAVAQQSASYRLHEHVLHAGGRPAQGQIATSPSFRMTLDAIGTPVATVDALKGAGFVASAGFVPGLRPTREVEGVLFTSGQDLIWGHDSGIGDYVVYRGPLSSHGGAGWGDCLQWGLTHPEATDAEVPASGTGFQYLIGARNRLRELGPLGATTDGVPRTPSTVCP